MTIQVVDFFSGCGGTSLGLQQAGMEIVAGLDNDPNAASTYRLNFPNATMIDKDIRSVQSAEIDELTSESSPRLFAGCAPCQPFSRQNQSRKAEDARRTLLVQFERFVVDLQPEFVMIENVPGMQKIGSAGPFLSFLQTLGRLGYSTRWDVLAAADFGVPQARKRLVLMASRKLKVVMPELTHGPGRTPYATFSDWVHDLPSLEAGEVDSIDLDHAAMKLSHDNLVRIRATPEGGDRRNWPDSLQLDCHKGHKGHTDVYGRLSRNRMASAMTTRCLSYSNGRYGHPVEDRALSLREAALLQTFPRNFRFDGSLLSKGRQVGNAVPPLMAKRVGEGFMLL